MRGSISWTTYFHFSNRHISMSWLWFLPALFLFDCLYLLVRNLKLPIAKLRLSWTVAAVFLSGFAYSVTVGDLGWIGWTKTPLIDFQNERLVPYFLVFLLGAQCQRLAIFDPSKRNMKLYIAVNAAAWIPINIYVVVLLSTEIPAILKYPILALTTYAGSNLLVFASNRIRVSHAGELPARFELQGRG